MMKSIHTAVALIILLAVTACSAANISPMAAITSESSQSAVSSTVDSSKAFAGENSAVNNPSLIDSEDLIYDKNSAITISLLGDTIETSAKDVQVEGSRAVITAPGVYILSGSLTDGQIVVDTDSKDPVKLVLDGVNIHSSTSAPVYIADAGKVVIVLADQSENILGDGSNYQFSTPDEEEPDATVFSKADLFIGGGGVLTVNANFRDGISSKDGLIIAGGVITVNAVDDGLRGKDYLALEGGTLTVFAGGDGLNSDNDQDAGMGNISIANTLLNVTSGGDAIDAKSLVSIASGTLNLTSGGGSGALASDDASSKGMKGGTGVTIEGGDFVIDSADDGVHSNSTITINGGTFRIASADDGMHADETLTINGGAIQIINSYEGLESAVITINDGVIQIAASDDSVNVAGGVDASGMGTGMTPGGGQNRDAFAASGNNYLYIRGGYLYADARGDGLDINGAIEMSGGLVVINGPTAQMNGALDYDRGFNIRGGVLIAAGSSGMSMAPDSSSSQSSVLINLPSTLPGGSVVNIQNQAGESILTFTPSRDFQSIAFSSPALMQGESYTVFTGGQANGAVLDGLYQDGSYSPGVQAATFSVTSAVTYVGTTGNQRPGGGQPPGGPGIRP